MATGIICEYNPFHKGHLYHLQTVRARTQDAPIICVMSGHYVQRGEPALLDKWTRTRMALAGGAALVLELPSYYSTATAEWFAYGAVVLLQATGLVDTLSFGMEDPSLICALQDLIPHVQPESDAYRSLLQTHLASAPSFAAARSQALQELAGLPLPLTDPNSILAFEYLKALARLNWHPVLCPVRRVSAGYHDPSLQAEYPSASAIRREAAMGRSIQPYLPDCCQPFLPSPLVFPWDLFSDLSYALSLHTAQSLRGIDEVAEGLENRILAAADDFPDYETLLSRLKTKRYPTSRLRRILLNLLLQITTERKQALRFRDGPAYIRVLGFRREHQMLLSQLCRKASLPVVTNLPRQLPELTDPARSMLLDEIRFTRIYAQHRPGLPRDCEYRQPLIVQD